MENGTRTIVRHENNAFDHVYFIIASFVNDVSKCKWRGDYINPLIFISFDLIVYLFGFSLCLFYEIRV